MSLPRRWAAGISNVVSGIEFSVKEGNKFPGDLRLEAYSVRDRRWVPVDMAVAFYLVDFLTENEEARREYMGHWRQNGDMYFMRSCVTAVREGWRVAADEVTAQRKGTR